MKDIEIYVLTHEKFDVDLNSIYVPLLCGSENLNDDFGYLKDNVGDNISDLNKYYAELTGEYWAWKHSTADIIGFCHYRRFFMQNFLLNNKLTKVNIENILKKYDIILPQKTHLDKTIFEQIAESYEKIKMGPKASEYGKIKRIIQENYPDYLKSFENVLNSKEVYNNNMFRVLAEII